MIRILATQELSAALWLSSLQSWQLKEWDVAAIVLALQTPGTSLLLAERGSAPAGYLLWRIAGDFAEIYYVYTQPEQRRLGVARELLRAAQVAATAARVANIILEVRVSHAGTIALYAALGFRQLLRKPRYYADQEDAWLMSWEILA